METKRFLFIDGLRGLAALAVVLFHVCRDYLGLSFLEFGRYGVVVFFVLSGFVITHALNGKKVTGGYFLTFVLKRSVRLDPAYWAAIAAAILLLLFQRVVFNHPAPLPDWQHVVLHLFYLQDLVQVPAISAVFWTLCYEFQFYLVFCALLWLLNRLAGRPAGSRRATAVFVALLLISLTWPLGLNGEMVHGLFVNLWYLFLMGAFARWALDDRLAGLALLVAVLILIPAMDQSMSGLTSLVGCATAGVLLAAGHFNKMGSWLTWRWVQYLGAISYSLYLTHDIFGIYIRSVGMHLTAKYLDQASLGWNYWWCGVALAACIVIAHAFYRFIEKPSHALSRRITTEAVQARAGVIWGRLAGKHA